MEKNNKKKKEKVELIDDIKINNNKYYLLFIITTIFFITNIVFILLNNSFNNSLIPLINNILIFLFTITFILLSIKAKKNKITLIGLIIFVIYSSFNILYSNKVFSIIENNKVLNLYNQTITYSESWAKENNITIEKYYEYSDLIKEHNIISQSIEPGTLINTISKIVLIISNGPDYNKEVIIPNFMGWNFENTIKYLEDNYLNNININFINSPYDANTVVNQSKSGTVRRSDLINIDFSIKEIEETKIIDLKNKSLLYASSWLKMNGFKYEIKEEFNDKIEKNHIIDNTFINEVKNPENDIITLTVSKGKMIKIPDITSMTQEELNQFIINNKLKINYKEIYNEEIKLGNIIESNFNENDIIEMGDTIEVTISKGKLVMIKIISIDEFIKWATLNNVEYELNYENDNNIKKDNIIKTSHKEGDLIKTDDIVKIYISKGKVVTIPTLTNLSKSAIETKCKELNITCSFTYYGLTEKTKKDIAVKQSKPAGTSVSEGTNIIITLSSGIVEKVTLPSFVGKTKTEATTLCKKTGITCNYVYETSYSSKAKDTVTKQSKTGTVNKGSTITLTLSKGPAKTYNIVIDPNQLTPGNPEQTKKTLQARLSEKCPGVSFTYVFQKSNSAIGYLASNSEVKVGNNTLTQGKTYKVIINSN